MSHAALFMVSVYLFLLIFRPYEYWDFLQGLYIERVGLILLFIIAIQGKNKSWHSSPINWSICLFVLTSFVSTMASIDPGVSFNTLYELFKFSILYFIFQILINDKKDVRNLIISYVAVMGVYVAKSAWEFFLNGRHVYRMGISRMIGIDATLGDPNAFAASMVYSLPFAVVLINTKNLQKYIRYGAIGYCLLAMTCLIFTGSRSGQISCIFLGMMILLVSKHKALYILIASILLMLVWFNMPYDYQARFLSAFDQEIGPANAAESANSRLELYKIALDIFLENFLFGVGPGLFIYYTNIGLKPHSLYGQLASENGLMGILAFAIYLSSLFYEIVRGLSGPDDIQGDDISCKRIALACFMVIALLLFNGLSGHNLYRFNWVFVAAIAVGCRHAFAHKDRAC